MTSESAAQPLRAGDGAGEPLIVKVCPLKHASNMRPRGHTGYTVNTKYMTICDVEPGFGAPEGSKIVAANGVSVSSWEDYLGMTGWTSKGRLTTPLK